MGYITSMTRHEELALSLFMPMIWDKSDLLVGWNGESTISGRQWHPGTMGVGLRHFKNWFSNLAIENHKWRLSGKKVKGYSCKACLIEGRLCVGVSLLSRQIVKLTRGGQH